MSSISNSQASAPPTDRLSDIVRLAALHRTGLLDSDPEQSFDRLTQLVQSVLRVPISLISLVDAERQFFKSTAGLPPQLGDLRETPLSHSFCQHVVMSGAPLIVNNAESHPLVCNNLAVRDLGVRAYLGAPLVLPDGHVIGSMCAIDTSPREWTKEELDVLSSLAESVMSEVAVRMHLRDREHSMSLLMRRNAGLRLISELAAELLAEPDPQRVFADLFGKVARYLDADLFFNFTFDPTAKPGEPELRLNCAGGIDEATRECFSRIHLGQALCGLTAQLERPIYLPELQSSDNPNAIDLQQRGVKVYACEPLRSCGKVLGTISFASTLKSTFAEDELSLIQTISHCVASAVERMNNERELTEARNNAIAANQAKDKFLAVLSHELRTPLTPVLMTLSVMEKDLSITAAQRDEIAMIRRNVELETKLIDDLLDLSRITAGKLSLNRTCVDINEEVKNVCDICLSPILEKGIRLQLQLTPNLPSIQADAGRLQQVLWNVLKNSAKFTPRGGFIFVSTMLNDAGQVVVRMRDTGIGIGPDILPRIFDAFEQGDEKISRQFGGLGLGLAISKALMDLHGGSISARSEGKDEGSEFIITWPVDSDTPAPREATPRESATTEGPFARVLIVEDHPDTARVLGAILEDCGYAVTTATCVSEALAAIDAQTFDVMVSDIGLPDGTGNDLMRQVRVKQNCIGIAMSGYGMEDDLRESRAAGFADHLVKPIRADMLEQTIRRLMQNAGR